MDRSGRVAVGLAAVAVGGALADVALRVSAGQTAGLLASNTTAGDAVAVGYGLAGLYLARARPRHVLGWLLLGVAVVQGLVGLTGGVAVVAEPSALQTFAAWWSSWTFFLGFGPIPTVLVLLYPTGRAGRWRRRVVAASLTGTVLVALALAVAADAVDDVVPGLQNPVAVPALMPVLALAGAALLLPCVLLTVVDAVLRIRRGTSPEREQLLWLVLAAAASVGGGYLPLGPAELLLKGLVPIAIAVGVVRHRLLDLQVVVRRTLLFAGLTALVVVVFVATTSALAPLVDGDGVPVAVSAALVALLLTPARDRLQRAVDRVVYGDRRDPVRAVAGLGRDVARHEVGDLVPQVLATVAAAVRSPHVLLVGADGTAVAEAGQAADGAPLHLPLRVGSSDVGALLVAPRTVKDAWGRADVALLDVLAPHVAVVVHAARLYDEVAASRDRVVAATRDERDRLRAELHDGLGPALSGIALGLEAAEVCLARDPARAGQLLARLRQETQAAGREVRRLVDGLQPAALEGRGLREAVASFVDALAAGSSVDISLVAPEEVPALGPEVEAAAYRIIAEAVTNVVRHSGARTCQVALACAGGSLVLSVEDDGSGLPVQPRDGVGLASMRRRAAELGGTWRAGARPGGGTRVEVVLPVRLAVTG